MIRHLIDKSQQGPEILDLDFSGVFPATNSKLVALNLKTYKKFRKTFTDSGVSYLRQYLLKNLANNSPFKMMFTNAYHTLNLVSDILMLSEMELVYWGILIEATSKTERSTMNPQLLAVFTAFMSKCYLNDEYEPFEYFLNTVIPNFKLNFYN